MGKTLLAGPWVGEFGWELFCWQGFIRDLSRDYEKTIVIGRPTNAFLYEDFAEFVPFDPESFETDAWRCNNAKSANELVNSIPHDQYFSGQFDIGFRYASNHGLITMGQSDEQEFHQYSSDITDEGYDVILHGRNKSTGSERNWSLEQWEKLVSIIPDDLSIACIGNDEAFHIEGTEDKRNIDLETLCAIMKNSKVIAGPSSGPMHFASLCGLKHIVWSEDFNRERYQKLWNPFKTKVIYYSADGWNPDPNDIKDLIMISV